MSSIVLVVVLVVGFCSLVPKLRTCLASATGPAPTDLHSLPSSSLGAHDLRSSRFAHVPKQELRRSRVPKRELGNQRRHTSTAARALSRIEDDDDDEDDEE